MTTEKPPLPPAVHTRGTITYGRTHAWLTPDGNVAGVLDIGSGELAFDDVTQVREMITRLAGLAGEMDAEISRHQACVVCGASGVPLDDLRYEPGQRCHEHRRCDDRKAQRAGAVTP